MTQYAVTRLRDAFAVYATIVAAESEDEAWAIAEAWDYSGHWKQVDVLEFDHTERGEIEEIDAEIPAASALAVSFEIERRGEEFFFRASHKVGGEWHGPYTGLHDLAETIAHYVLEDALEAIATDGNGGDDD